MQHNPCMLSVGGWCGTFTVLSPQAAPLIGALPRRRAALQGSCGGSLLMGMSWVMCGCASVGGGCVWGGVVCCLGHGPKASTRALLSSTTPHPCSTWFVSLLGTLAMLCHSHDTPS